MKKDYLNKFFIDGKITINEGTVNERKKLFKSLVKTLYLEHSEFVEKCTSKNILKIDNTNFVIELVL